MSSFNNWKTREVRVGSIGIGGKNPLRIQSMTTCPTQDVEQTVQQILRLADKGCDLARVTVQGMKEADACEAIKNSLLQKGCFIPLIADIHFFPPAALRVADFADKVRVNPGNYVDKRASFQKKEYDEKSYLQELEKIEEKLVPLIEKCKKFKRALRIGTNHGSLSDRIMNYYGDTPKGMVESALEFARVCRKYDYHAFLFSMKSSNPRIMIAAYRLLVEEMLQLGWDYPLHLGVTEAGEGEDGRIKSAIGIGSLLLDGIGDTIRVSLTEDPWEEIDPCQRILAFAKKYHRYREEGLYSPPICRDRLLSSFSPPLHQDSTVFLSASPKEEPLKTASLQLDLQPDAIVSEDTHSSSLYVNAGGTTTPLISLCELSKNPQGITGPFGVIIQDGEIDRWELLQEIAPIFLILSFKQYPVYRARRFFKWLLAQKKTFPVILNFAYDSPKEDLLIQAAIEYGSLLCDGLGEGLWIQATHDSNFLCTLSFNILQASGLRSFKTDFISCPGCGRTLFDLQEVSARIRSQTAHLPGVKIAIMGCIVNGPGEMADAHFGYVGSKTSCVDLYVGKTCVEKNIPSSEAEKRLIALIKKEGRWVEPS
jgi:(E)-4-hydroxy-3-methylbut-2-enyl-diphosphate synthase